jgi:hypothetical protein
MKSAKSEKYMDPVLSTVHPDQRPARATEVSFVFTRSEKDPALRIMKRRYPKVQLIMA